MRSQLSLITSVSWTALVVALTGCSQSVAPASETRLLRATSAADLADCEAPERVCTASEPPTCYWVCADDPGGGTEDGCTPETVCVELLTYPPMEHCFDTCGGGSDPSPDDCRGIVATSNDSGDDVLVCIDDPGCVGGSPGGEAPVPLRRALAADELEGCEAPTEVCTASEPAMCHWVCGDAPIDGCACETTCVELETYPPMTRCFDSCAGGDTDPGSCDTVVSSESGGGEEVLVCVGDSGGSGASPPESSPGGASS